MEKSESAKIFDEIVSALTEAGYEPLMQINGYLETGNITYITRKNNAREKILLLSHTDLENYIAQLYSNRLTSQKKRVIIFIG